MNVRFLKSVLSACVCAAAVSAQATFYTVGNGETFAVTGTSGDVKNVRGNCIDAQGGSILQFEPSQSGSSWFANCWYSIQSTNGVVTLDLSKITEKGMVSNMGSLFASGNGSFRVIGANFFYMGRGDVGDGFMTLDAASLAFYDENGNETDGTISFSNQCCIKALPQSDKITCSYTCTAEGKYIALAGENPLGLKSGDVFTVPCNMAIFGTETVFPSGTKISVAKGASLLVAPADPPIFREGPANANNYILPKFHAGVLSTDVELAEGSSLVFGYYASDASGKAVVTDVTGTVSGFGAVSVFGAVLANYVSFEALPVAGDVAFSSFPAGMACKAVDSAPARVPTAGSTVAPLYAQGGQFVLEDVDWRKKVTRWYDPSRTDLCGNVGRKTGFAGQYDLYYTNDYPLVESVSDCRGTDCPQMLLNNRIVGGSDPKVADLYPDFYPYLVLNGQNGLSYLSCSYYLGAQPTDKYRRVNMGVESQQQSKMPERRRLWFSEADGSVGQAGITTAKVVMMVFGSQQGGGAAMIAAGNKAFLRGADATHHALTDPVIANDNHVVWIDGERKEKPSETYFSGGWQIVTVDVTGETLYGFGASGDTGTHQECGGQNYGEILIFDTELTETERIAAERYLAVKWGLVGQYKSSLGRRVDLIGAGTASVDFSDTIEIGGQFSGTVTLAGGTLAVPDELSPFTESDLPKTNRTGWFDPDCREWVSLYSDVKPDSVTPDYLIGLWNRDGTPKTTGELFFSSNGTGSSRRPSYVRAARSLGPERGWVDNDHIYPSGLEEQYPGNALRLRPWDGNWGASSSDQGLHYQTAFIVMDSQRGGGSQLMDVYGGTGLIRYRQTGIASNAIWPSGTSANVTGGEARLNSLAVDPANGFTGRAEVFSYNTINGTSVNAVALGYYGNTDSKANQNGEIFGEILLYDRVVLGDERKRIEAYLMGKWLGRMPEGCSDLSGMTVAGTGAVTSHTAARLPKFAADFAGMVSVTESTFDMTYDGALSGTVLAPAATLDCPASCTIKVDFLARPAKGRYELVSAQNVKDIAWTLETTGDVGNRRIELVVDETANKVYLDVLGNGLMLIFK